MTRDLGHGGVGDGGDHLGSGADDAAPFRVAADHEAVDVVQKDQRNQVLVAVHDEARGFFGALGVDDAAEFDALFAGVAGLGLRRFLVGDDADGDSADAGVAADEGAAVVGAVFVELAAVDDTGMSSCMS